MRRTAYLANAIQLATEATAFGMPPATGAYVDDVWRAGPQASAIPELEVEIWGDVAVDLTNVTLYEGTPHPLVVAATPVTSISSVTNLVTLDGHGFQTGDGPLDPSTTGTLPTGLVGVDPVYVIVHDINTFYLASSLKDAILGNHIAMGSAGTGTFSLTGAESERVYWHELAELGTSGAVTVTGPGFGYVERLTRSPRAVAYAITGSFSAGDAVNVAIAPIVDAA